ncbi:hypothetical protein ACOZ35_12730 [Halorubrum xinjiangense]|uniref:hypothetical protein n=1 Tax=Halorubrum xinjiangense TaxID=261291 RepID=UPI003C6F470D
MPNPNSQTDAGPAPDADLGPESESASRDGPTLLAATPDADAVFDQLRTLAVLAGFLALLVTLITVELLVRI